MARLPIDSIGEGDMTLRLPTNRVLAVAAALVLFGGAPALDGAHSALGAPWALDSR